MGFKDMIRGEFVDIIEWLDNTNTKLAWRFPRYDNEIKNGAQLIVREGQRAIFVYRGQLADQYDPGHYQLTSENIPIMSMLQGWRYGFNSPFRAEVYFINPRPVTDLRWGTPQPVTVRDPDFKMVQVRANGTHHRQGDRARRLPAPSDRDRERRRHGADHRTDPPQYCAGVQRYGHGHRPGRHRSAWPPGRVVGQASRVRGSTSAVVRPRDRRGHHDHIAAGGDPAGDDPWGGARSRGKRLPQQCG